MNRLFILAFISLAFISPKVFSQIKRDSELLYTFSYQNQSQVQLGKLFETSKPPTTQEATTKHFQVKANGLLLLTLASASAERLEIVGTITKPNVRLFVDGKEDFRYTRQLVQGLQNFTIIQKDGKILELRLQSTTHPLAKNLLIAIISATQISGIGNVETLQSWVRTEEDGNGVFRMQYENQTPNQKSLIITKTKLEYIGSQEGLRVVPISKAEIRYDLTCRCLKSLSHNEKLSFMANEQPQVIGVSTTALSFSLVKKNTVTSSAQQVAQALRNNHNLVVHLFDKSSALSSQAAIHKQELKGETLVSLLKKLADFEKSTRPVDERSLTSLYLKFKALVFLQPQSCGDITRLLTHAKPDSLSFQLLIPALAEIGNAQSQAALLFLFTTRKAEFDVQQLLIASLGQIQNPNTEIESVLRKIVEDESTNTQTRVTAVLALGNLAKRLLSNDPQRSRKLIDDITELLSKGKEDENEGRRRLLLAFLGNAAAGYTIETISRSVSSSLPATRAAAASSLRMIHDEAAKNLLLKLMMEDKDENVRFSAVKSLSNHPTTELLLNVYRTWLANEPASRIRIALIENLSQAAKLFPIEVRDACQLVSTQDTDEKVREAANKFLNQRVH